MSYEPDLIYDVGLHRGEDTRFYLAKGFRVVAVEAAPDLADAARVEFAKQIANGALTVLNVAVAERRGPVELYLNPTTEWNTTRADVAQQKVALRAAEITTVTVKGVPFGDIVAEYGVPYFLKVDIEGADMLCVQALRAPDLPRYLSMESDKLSWRGLRREFEVLQELGYRRFKVVPQHRVAEQVPPPVREGRYVPWRFEHMASGLFGEEAPGRWMTAREALAVYAAIFARYRAYGDRGFLRYGVGLRVARVFGAAGWYDTHARL